MTNLTTTSPIALMPGLEAARQDVDSSFERFCLTAGIEAMEQMLRGDAQRLVGRPHSRGRGRVGQRWGATKGKIGFHMCVGRACAATAMRFNCRPGERPRPRIGLAAGR